MQKVDLAAQPRTSKGSGAARRHRREGLVPSVLYGHGEAASILVESRSLEKILKSKSGRNVILNLKLSGQDETAIIRDLQRHAVSRAMLHVDFQRISLTERIVTAVSVEVTGTSEAIVAGGILMVLMHTVEVESLPLEIPEKLVIDISGIKSIGDVLHASDLKMPEGVTLKTLPEAPIVTVTPPEKEEAPPAEAPVEGEAAAAEPEVIAKGKEKEGEGAEGAAPGAKGAAPAAKGAAPAPAAKAAPEAKGKK